MKRPLRNALISAVCAFFVGFAGLIGVTAANAGTGLNGFYGPVYGFSYKNVSEAWASTRTYAVAAVAPTSTSTVPAGYMSANARLFLATGELCKQTGHIYTGTWSSNFAVVTQGSGCAYPSAYYGWSVTGAWNGSSYNYYYAPQSTWVNGV